MCLFVNQLTNENTELLNLLTQMVYIVKSIGADWESEQDVLELARRDKVRVDDIVSLSQGGDNDSISVCTVQLDLSSLNSLNTIKATLV